MPVRTVSYVRLILALTMLPRYRPAVDVICLFALMSTIQRHSSSFGQNGGCESSISSKCSSPLATTYPTQPTYRRTFRPLKKGVTYDRHGDVLNCRFCAILSARAEDFLYEDKEIAVFRPLAPVAPSHILVVPRCHVRNVNHLQRTDLALLYRMKTVAERVLGEQFASLTTLEASSSSTGPDTTAATCKFAFHTPPFNSIDHVHMHAFRVDEQPSVGTIGAIKFRTATWWCRSYEEILRRLQGMHDATTPHSDDSNL